MTNDETCSLLKTASVRVEKNISIVCQHIYPELVSTGLLMTELATGLEEKGWNVSAYAARPTSGLVDDADALPPHLTFEGVDISRIPTIGSHDQGILHRLLFALTYTVSALVALLREKRTPDGIVVTTNPPFVPLIGRIAAGVLGIPYVVIVHDVYPDIAVRLGVLGERALITRIWRAVTSWGLNGAEAVVVLGEDMKEVVEARLHRADQRVHTIPNWSNEQDMRPVPEAENQFLREQGLEDSFVVLYSGNMGRTHNLEPLVEAAHLLSGQEVEFVLIGDGAKREHLEKQARRSEATNIRFLPYQPREQLADVLSAASLSVVCLDPAFTGLSVPSKTYGIMAVGTPILALLDPESEIGQTVRRHDCGIVLEQPTGEEVAQTIQSLADRPEQLRRMAENSRSAFLNHYTREQAIDRYEAVMQEAFS